MILNLPQVAANPSWLNKCPDCLQHRQQNHDFGGRTEIQIIQNLYGLWALEWKHVCRTLVISLKHWAPSTAGWSDLSLAYKGTPAKLAARQLEHGFTHFQKIAVWPCKVELEGPSLSLLPAQKLEAILKNCRVWWENDLSKAPRIARQFLPCRGSWWENALVRFARKCRCWEQPSSANWIVCSRTTPSAKMEPVNQIMLWSSRTIYTPLHAYTRIFYVQGKTIPWNQIYLFMRKQ